MTTRKGFTLIELLVVISIIALLIGILLPALGAARRTARQIQNSTQLRGIHQGLVIFAQSNKSGSGEGYYAGLDANGNDVATTDITGDYGAGTAATVSASFAILLNNNQFTPEYIINPSDTGKTEVASGGTVGTGNHSYATIDYGDSSAAATQGTITSDTLQAEWRETINTAAIVIFDRDRSLDNTIGDSSSDANATVWSDSGYKGTMTRNDGSTNFESDHEQDGLKYGTSSTEDGVDVPALGIYD